MDGRSFAHVPNRITIRNMGMRIAFKHRCRAIYHLRDHQNLELRGAV